MLQGKYETFRRSSIVHRAYDMAYYTIKNQCGIRTRGHSLDVFAASLVTTFLCAEPCDGVIGSE